jgi:hypothetical protein
MTTVVAIMDQPGWSSCTDNIVVVATDQRSLLWVPRDLWCVTINDRINTAFATGGHAGLVAALAEHQIIVEHSICVSRTATGHAIERLAVTVPIERPIALWYQLQPLQPIQHGRKLVRFTPPAEELRGERIHQWIGARYAPRDGGGSDGSDLRRITRQHTFVRALIGQGFDFSSLLSDEALIRVSSDEAVSEVARVRADWRFDVLEDLFHARIRGKRVLLPRTAIAVRSVSAAAISKRPAGHRTAGYRERALRFASRRARR